MTIWALGSNGSGQLGIGNTLDVDEPVPVRLATRHKKAEVNKIVAGGNHTLFLLRPCGTLLATGFNAAGCCGDTEDEDATDILEPQVTCLKLDDETTVREFYDVSATWTATFFVDKDRHRIFVRGSGVSGELGLGETTIRAIRSSCIAMPSPIKSIVSCLAHTVVVLQNGEAWGWGKGRKGQLGDLAENCWLPKKIVLDFKIDKVVLGADFSCFLSEPHDGCIELLGAGARDRHGLRVDCPPSVLNWTDAAATWGGVTIRTPSKLYAWGRNERGQRLPSDVPLFKAMAAGSEHWLILLHGGKVIVGGWGEHGNCGRLPEGKDIICGEDHALIVDNQIEGEVPRQVFAGCATTFIVT